MWCFGFGTAAYGDELQSGIKIQLMLKRNRN
jgi:hypothetical protein